MEGKGEEKGMSFKGNLKEEKKAKEIKKRNGLTPGI